MSRRVACRTVFLFAVVAICGLYVFPPAALLVRASNEGWQPEQGWVLSARQSGLFLETLILTACATATAIVVGLPAAACWARRGASSAITIGMAACMIVSPMTMCFGWQHLLKLNGAPSSFGHLGTVLIWAGWTWPIPALLLGEAWRRGPREAYESALLCCSRRRAFVHIVLPGMRAALAASALAVGTLLVTEFVVPHAWGLNVYATELLAAAESSSRTLDTVGPALPVCLCAWLGLMLVSRMRRSLAGKGGVSESSQAWAPPLWMRIAALGVVVLTVIVPVSGAAYRMQSWRWLGEVLRVHGGDLTGSLGTAAAAGAAAVGIATAGVMSRRFGAMTVAVAVGVGILPAVVVGEAIICGYGGWSATQDHWVKLAAGWAARFGWLPVVAALATSARCREIEEQAVVDGADASRIAWSLRVRRQAPLILAGGAAAGALSLGDLATTVQAQVSSFVPISVVLVDKMHKFEDGYVLAISLILALVAAPCVAAAAWAVRRVS
ncbi:MAG: hypothetical protein KJ057_09155 [Phycisphaerae bacterium]|nr:hypothetical protein [Planctomycetia bacterium]MCK6465077.1 hypothetical protein [Phycisphaerae bacterium]MCL4718625.1 hypothetical protein [Phycisphaerae bacterium]MCQ3920722.1 hypothetical protein [Planctomycetota bacterium]NUQ08372.1 hypothetical protein [Phycisphaerae bacterium]